MSATVSSPAGSSVSSFLLKTAGRLPCIFLSLAGCSDLGFPLVASRRGAIPFFFFASTMALQFVVLVFSYPETRGVTLEAMENNLNDVRNPAAL